jgi:hypothetical protein
MLPGPQSLVVITIRGLHKPASKVEVGCSLLDQPPSRRRRSSLLCIEQGQQRLAVVRHSDMANPLQLFSNWRIGGLASPGTLVLEGRSRP